MRTSGENDFLIPSANPPDKRSQRPTWPGFLFTLLLAVGVFGVSTGAARFFFPRGLAGRQGARKEAASNFFSREDDGGYKTWECAASITGDPVMNGADTVSYFSLTEGEAAKYGTGEYKVSYNGYTFWFVSGENKALFEVDPSRYIPMWGGFCAYGIAEEDWWTSANLGPDTDPNSWTILGGKLYFFRSEYPKSLFMENIALNLRLGEDNWSKWWGSQVPAGGGEGSPLNTACFCSVETCFDF